MNKCLTKDKHVPHGRKIEEGSRLHRKMGRASASIELLIEEFHVSCSF
jgi:hypothetical protein